MEPNEVALRLSHTLAKSLTMMRARHFLFIAVFGALLAGCNNSPQSKIIGQWQLDQANRVSNKIAPPGQDDSDPPKMSVVFERSGRLKTVTQMGNIDSTKEGRWKWIAWDESKQVMQLECQLGLQTTQHAIEFEDDDSIRWIPPNMAGTTQKIRFVRP